MAVLWHRMDSINFLKYCLKLRSYRWLRISNFRGTTTPGVKKGLSLTKQTTNKEKREDNFFEEDVATSGKRDENIPSAGNLNLYEYVKTLESSIAQEKGTILKSWSRLTKLPRNKHLNVSGGLRSGTRQCLGVTAHLLEQRLKFLHGIGIKGKDALIIALEFPAFLSWDSPNFGKILKVLTELKCDIVRLLCRKPYVFGLDFERVTENVKKLANAGVSEEIIGKLVTFHPLILSFPLRDESMDIIKVLLDYHNNIPTTEGDFEEGFNTEEAVLNLLLQPLEKTQEQVNFQEKFQHVVSFLRDLQVSPLIVAAKNPSIFHTDISTLQNAVEFFTSKPLLLEMEVIQHLLTSRSEIFVNFDDDTMRTRVQLIYGIVRSPTALYNLILDQSSFVFDKGDTTMEDIIQWFRDMGVEDKKLRDLLTLKNCFSLKKREMEEKLEYLLSLKGVTMEAVRSHPVCLLKPLTHLKHRAEFLSAMKPDVLVNKDLGQIMLTKNKEFAKEVCGLSLEQFAELLNSMEKEGNSLKLSDE